MNQLLSSGDQGADVEHLRQALAGALGADADAFAVLKQAGSSIDSDFDAAIRRWQAACLSACMTRAATSAMASAAAARATGAGALCS